MKDVDGNLYEVANLAEMDKESIKHLRTFF
jgi:hypothetical protein